MKEILKGAIFYADLEPAIGNEENGFKPVVILQNDLDNKYSPTTIIAPIAIKKSRGTNQPTHVKVKQFNKIRPNSIILLEQIRTIDKSRLKGYVCMLCKEQMIEVENAIRISLDLE